MPLQRAPLLGLILAAMSAVAPLASAQGDPASALPPTQTSPQPPGGAAPSAAPSPASPSPAPVRLGGVVSAAEETHQRLKAILSILEAQPILAELEMVLPGAEATLVRLIADQSTLPLPSTRLGLLENLRQQWLSFDGELETLGGRLRSSVAEVEALSREVEQMRSVWELTQQAAVQAQSPRVLRERIRDVQETVGAVAARLHERLEALAAKGARIAGLRGEVERALQEIHSARSRARQHLFVIDSPPLWRALAAPGGSEAGLGREIREAWLRDVGLLRNYLAGHPWRRRIHLLVVLFVLALILVLRRTRAAAGGRASPDTFGHLMGRPVSASLVVALIATFFIYPAAPSAVYEFTLLALLLPLLRLLPGLAPDRLRGSFYGLAGLCFLDGLANLSPEGSRLQRLLLFLITLLALTGLGWLLRRGGATAKMALPAWSRAALVCARIGFLALAVSLVSNTVGNFSLSRLLTRATLNSAYLAVALYGGVIVVDTLLQVCVRSPLLRALRIVSAHGPLWERRGRACVHAAAFLFWAWVTLALFQVLDPLRNLVGAAFGEPLAIGSLSVSLGNVVVFILAVWVSTWLSRFVAFVLEEDVLSRTSLARGVPEAISMIARYSILVAGLFLALAAVGIGLDRLAIIVGALGVGVGFGLQHAVNNIVSGLILAFERPVRLGDTVAVGAVSGRMRRIGPRSSTVETYEGAEVIIPNGNLLAGDLVNWTLSNRMRRVEVKVGVAYGTEPRRVIEILQTAARLHPETLADPAPVALFRGFGESSLDFALWFWVGNIDTWMQVQSDIGLAIHDALRDAGIEIPFPQREFRMRDADSLGKSKAKG